MGFAEYRNLTEAELYNVLTSLANVRTNTFGFTESGQRLYDLATGLKDKMLTKEDIVGSEEADGLLNDFAEEEFDIDVGIDPEVINETLRETYGVGKKYEIDKDGIGKYVDDSVPHDWEGYIRKPKEEVKPEVKEDFTEKVLMAKIQEKLVILEKKYPELLDKDKAIDDAIELKKEIEKEIIEVKDGVKGGYNEKDIENYVNNLLEDLEKTDDFVDDDTLKNYSSIKDKLAINLKKVLMQFNDEGD